jgi:glycolate oxidase FAD binding subunit
MEAVIRAFQEALQDPEVQAQGLRLRGLGSKDFLGGVRSGVNFSTRAAQGIVAYEPEELYVTVRSGTEVQDLMAALDEKGQTLAFDPLLLPMGSTVGGMLASGLQGPLRVSAGALRDYVLGASLLDGRGRLLHFGGTVIKNVAGYDVSKMLAGAWGGLGFVTEVSLKTLPKRETSVTLRLALTQSQAIETVNRLAGRPLPLVASAFLGEEEGELQVLLSGAGASVDAAVRALTLSEGFERMERGESDRFWAELRTLQHPFLKEPSDSSQALWMFTVPSTLVLPLKGSVLIEWHGGRRWWWGAELPEAVMTLIRKSRGQIRCVRGCGPQRDYWSHEDRSEVLGALETNIRKVFDPDGRFVIRGHRHAG